MQSIIHQSYFDRGLSYKISTMTSLAEQLKTIRHKQPVLSNAPNQQQPTLIFDKHAATTTSADVFYTMAIIAYAKLVKEQPTLQQEGETVMSSANREIVRNTLTKANNRELSETLVRFMLKLSPYFMVPDCQKVMEYLLHNYKVNVFEAESLAIIFLQYWNVEEYLTLISNIPPKVLSVKLPFLAKLTSQEPHNITYIVKSLSYSHFLMSSLMLYTLEYIKN